MPNNHQVVLAAPGSPRQPATTVFEGDTLTYTSASSIQDTRMHIYAGRPGTHRVPSSAFLTLHGAPVSGFTIPSQSSVTVTVAPGASIPEDGGQFFTIEYTIENETSTLEFMVNTFTLGKPPSACEPRPVRPSEAKVNRGAYIYFNNEGDSVFCNVSLDRIHSAALFGTTAFYVTGPSERGEDENDAHMLVQEDLKHSQAQTYYLSLTDSHHGFGAGSTIKITVGTSPGDEYDKRETLERP